MRHIMLPTCILVICNAAHMSKSFATLSSEELAKMVGITTIDRTL